MNGFILLFFIFLCLTGLISYQVYLDLFASRHQPDENPEAKQLLGQPVTFPITDNLQGHGFYLPAATSSTRVLLLVPDHLQSVSHVFPLAQYFQHLGYNVLTYDQTAARHQRSFRFGHYHTEGRGCLALMHWYEQTHGAMSDLAGIGVGFGGTTLMQLHKNGMEFSFLILEHLPISFSHYLQTRIAHVLSPFWWRNFVQQLILKRLTYKQRLALDEISNLVSCDTPILLLNSENHPLISSAETYRFLPYYRNMQAFTFTNNYTNSALYSDPERYFFLLDTFLKQSPVPFQ